MKDKLEILDLLLKADKEPFLSNDWIMKKVLKLNDNELRMYKIQKIWEIK